MKLETLLKKAKATRFQKEIREEEGWPARFRALIASHGAETVAAALGVTRGAVYHWARGSRAVPETARLLADRVYPPDPLAEK